MQMVILAGGKGERLKPITDTRPKPMIIVAGKTIVERLIEAGYREGIRRFVVVTGYMADLLSKHVGEVAERLGVEVEAVRQKEERGSGDALLTASSYISEESLVVYGDLLIGESVIRKVVSSGAPLIVGVRHKEPWNYGVIVERSGEAVRVIEKPDPSEVKGEALVNAGIYVLSPGMVRHVEKIQESPRGEVELTDLVEILYREGRGLRVISIDSDEWMDIGRPWDVLEANKRVIEKIHERTILGEVEGSVTIKGPVYIGRGARVKGNTYIEGPVYIDEEAQVGPNAYIRPFTYIGRNSVVGFSVEVKASVVFEGTKMPHLSYVGDSVICEKVNLGAGTIIANFRFDEQPVKVWVKGSRISSGRVKLGAFIGGYVKTGVNSSILPGVKIGAYSIIYPGVVVSKDVEYGGVVKSSI
ncbi:MAG TPA: bifunctional sugar-1-phosphate nucleotidylyltransferase/acetyltransferase [Sulfolobales archaeon]|nr:bifunctional sugar-1-phosphate nucleotidylyltransferase/acetyltransferase [Sulfolobales archaeon]